MKWLSHKVILISQFVLILMLGSFPLGANAQGINVPKTPYNGPSRYTESTKLGDVTVEVTSLSQIDEIQRWEGWQVTREETYSYIDPVTGKVHNRTVIVRERLRAAGDACKDQHPMIDSGGCNQIGDVSISDMDAYGGVTQYMITTATKYCEGPCY